MQNEENPNIEMTAGRKLQALGLAAAIMIGGVALEAKRVQTNANNTSQAPTIQVEPVNSLENLVEAENDSNVEGVFYQAPQRNETTQIVVDYGPFTNDTTEIALARTLFGEARGQIKTHPDYVYGVGETIKTRSERSGMNIKDVVLQRNNIKVKTKSGTVTKTIFQYTCFDPNDKGYKAVVDPLKHESEQVWNSCYNLGVQVINNQHKGDENLKGVTNYYVGYSASQVPFAQRKQFNIPRWAYDKKGNPIDSIDVNVTQTEKNPKIKAHFYKF